MDRFADAFRAELTAFTDVVAGTIHSPCTVADAVEVGWIAEAATLSRQQHRPIRMDDIRTRSHRMTTAPSQFLAACWTSAGDVVPFRGVATSPIDIATRIERSPRCGYIGFGLTREDLVVARDTIGLRTRRCAAT